MKKKLHLRALCCILLFFTFFNVFPQSGSVVWNGSVNSSWSLVNNWTPAVIPDNTSEVSIVATTNQPLISDNASVNTLTMGANTSLTVQCGTNLTISNALTVDNLGSLLLENGANLLQINNTVNSGKITVKRNSSALKRYDYTLWSSPVDGQQLLAFSPLTVTNRFYNYNSATNLYAAMAPTVDFETAKGYLIRMPNNHPDVATVWNGAYTGVPHNGNYSYTMNVGDETHRFNLVGNPYPSPISMADFVSENSSSITGTLYFWRKTNNAANPSYCTWVDGTFVDNGEAEATDPNGVINTGQGFFVEATALATSVIFANSQRIPDTSNQFFKTPTLVERNRIWLNATNASGAFSQMEVGYVTNGTQGLDVYDGKYLNDGGIELYSLVDTKKLVIQGRSLPFNTTDIVSLGFKTGTAGTYTITLDHVDGLFTGSQDIFIKDNLTGTVHDIKIEPYTFTSVIGTFDSRFEIVYTNYLGKPSVALLDNQIITYRNNDNLIIESGSVPFESYKVFDVRGRLLAEEKSINGLKSSLQAGWSHGILLVHITSETGEMVVKKVMW